jgi:hypothetical protein
MRDGESAARWRMHLSILLPHGRRDERRRHLHWPKRFLAPKLYIDCCDGTLELSRGVIAVSVT